MSAKKVNKNSVIISTSFSVLFFVILVIFSLFYVYWKIMEIEDLKQNLKTVVDDYNKKQKEWIEFGEFKSMISKSNYSNSSLNEALKSDYTMSLLSQVDQAFYNYQFKNTSSSWSILNYKDYTSYEDFLDAEKLDIEEKWAKEDFQEQEDLISTILPMYADRSEFYTETSLTNFKFINYIERLLRLYWLKTKSPIWITNVVAVENNENSDLENTKQETSSIDSDIYYIPLRLDLSWRKDYILKFLEDAANMGDISYKDWKIIVNNSKQIVEISDLSMKDYIDSSIKNNSNYDNLVDIINNEQANELFEITVELRFYVVWISSLKLKEEIWKIIWWDEQEWYYEKLLNYTNELIKKANIDTKIKNDISDINKTLLTLWKEIKLLQAKYKKSDDLESVFNEAQKYKLIFDSIDAKLLNISNKLNLK